MSGSLKMRMLYSSHISSWSSQFQDTFFCHSGRKPFTKSYGRKLALSSLRTSTSQQPRLKTQGKAVVTFGALLSLSESCTCHPVPYSRDACSESSACSYSWFHGTAGQAVSCPLIFSTHLCLCQSSNFFMSVKYCVQNT